MAEKVAAVLLSCSSLVQTGCHMMLDVLMTCFARLEPFLNIQALREAFARFELNTTTPKGIMNANLCCQLLASACFSISSMYVSQAQNAGYGVVITEFLYVGFGLAAFFVINKQQDAIFIGLILGAGIILTFFSILTSIFWGELSECEVTERKISKYSCREELKAAMRSVSLFATLMFLLQMSFTAMLFYWRTNILAESHQYSEVPYGAQESDEPLFVMKGASGSSSSSGGDSGSGSAKMKTSSPLKQISTNKSDFETLV